MTHSLISGGTDPKAVKCSAVSGRVCFNYEEQHLKHFLDKIQKLNNSISDITLILILSFTKWVEVLWKHTVSCMETAVPVIWGCAMDYFFLTWGVCGCAHWCKLSSLEHGDQDMSGSQPPHRSVQIVCCTCLLAARGELKWVVLLSQDVCHAAVSSQRRVSFSHLHKFSSWAGPSQASLSMLLEWGGLCRWGAQNWWFPGNPAFR